MADIKRYFTKPPRFQFVKLLGKGEYAKAYQIRFNDPEYPNIKNFVVKRSDNDHSAKETLQEEKNHLIRLRGNRHLVEIYDLPDIPLSSTNIDPDCWIILEYLPNGTIHSFIKLAKAKLGRGKLLPNRLLWRFFLCLIRSSIAMAWPDTNERVPNVEARNLSHNDIHYENVLLGEPLPDNEHRITPILKLIDFGMARYVKEGEKRNVQDIGEVMMYLIDLSTELMDPDADEEDLPEIVWEGQTIRTDATRIVPFKKEIDPLLQTLVCACLSTDDDLPWPSLNYLFTAAQNAIVNPSASYRNRPEEQDAYISRLWKDIVTTAPTR
ncbi:kinase-like protein [Hypoxylon cercidicola]|nr:kinase-like protein [Hypoxylon cercidicola]